MAEVWGDILSLRWLLRGASFSWGLRPWSYKCSRVLAPTTKVVLVYPVAHLGMLCFSYVVACQGGGSPWLVVISPGLGSGAPGPTFPKGISN